MLKFIIIPYIFTLMNHIVHNHVFYSFTNLDILNQMTMIHNVRWVSENSKAIVKAITQFNNINMVTLYLD